MDEGMPWQDKKGPHQDWEATKTRIVCLHLPSLPLASPSPYSGSILAFSGPLHGRIGLSRAPTIICYIPTYLENQSVNHLLIIFNMFFSNYTNTLREDLLPPKRTMLEHAN